MSNPYELRFNMLMEARTILVDEYHAKVDALMNMYHAMKDGGEHVKLPKMPEYPDFDEIQTLCNKMNSFVSNAGGKH